MQFMVDIREIRQRYGLADEDRLVITDEGRMIFDSARIQPCLCGDSDCKYPASVIALVWLRLGGGR